MSKGNLSVQAQKLEAAGYLQTTKGFRSRIPVTSFAITPDGRKALVAYHAQMRALLPDPGERDGRTHTKASRSKTRGGAGK